MVINARITATRLRCRADEMERAGYPTLADAVRKVAQALPVDESEKEELATAIHGHNPWKVMCGC